MKSIGDILSIGTVESTVPDARYAIVEFAVGYFKAGEEIGYNEIGTYLWDGKESWLDDTFCPSGTEGRIGFTLDKDTFAIVDTKVVGNAIGGTTALQNEMELCGMSIFQGSEAGILELAEALSKPDKENDTQYSTFLTLWKVSYEVYESIESMYPEYDVWAELIGPVDLEKIHAEMLKR
jgi:hypothetical protein